MSDLGDVLEFLLLLYVGLFRLVLNWDQSQTCAGKMAYWGMSELILIHVPIVTLGLSQIQGLPMIISFVFQLLFFASIGLLLICSIMGLVLLSISHFYTPNCLADPSLEKDVWNSALVVFCLGAVAIIFILYKGLSSCSSIFHRTSNRGLEEWMERRLTGYGPSVPPIQNYQSMTSVLDSYTLSAKEKDILTRACQLSPLKIEQLPEDDICPICLMCIQTTGEVISYPSCNHNFHSACILKWLEKKTNCPMCRKGIRTSLINKLSAMEVGLIQVDSRDGSE